MKFLKMNRAAGFILVGLCLLFTSCTKEIDPDLLGTWSRYHNFDGTAYEVELTFTDDGVLQWEPVSDIPGHTGSEVSYVANKEGFKIFNDDECSSEGQYSYTFSMSSLTITSESDDCAARVEAMSGDWEKIQ